MGRVDRTTVLSTSAFRHARQLPPAQAPDRPTAPTTLPSTGSDRTEDLTDAFRCGGTGLSARDHQSWDYGAARITAASISHRTMPPLATAKPAPKEMLLPARQVTSAVAGI